MEAAAIECGYASPKATATALLRHPMVRKALITATQSRLEGEAGPLAVQTIIDVLNDEKAPGAVKAKLALGVLDRIQAPKEDRGLKDKPLSELTPDELRQVIAEMRDSPPAQPQMRDVTPDKGT